MDCGGMCKELLKMNEDQKRMSTFAEREKGNFKIIMKNYIITL